VNGVNYTTSGLYADTLVNAVGCDSILTLDLTLNSSTMSADTAVACDSYTASWGTTYNSSGTYNATLTNAAGCDSTITLHLTILNGSVGFVTVVACGSYTWPLSGDTYTLSGWYNDTLTNAAGCDSVITLDLTILTIDNSVSLSAGTLTAAAGLTYQWVNCDSGFAAIAGATSQSFTPAASGNYAVILNDGTCTDTSACTNVTVVAVDASGAASITLSPNPSNGSFVLDLGSPHATASVVVRDVQGRLVLRETQHHVSRLSLSLDAPAGIYLIEVVADGKTSVLKLVKE
jgi:hypothetical protein